MKIDISFFKKIFWILIISIVIASYPLAVFSNSEIIIATAVGAILSTANIIAGYLSIEYAFNKSMTRFLKTILGGMGIRMFVLLLAMLFVIQVIKLHVLAFTISLFIYYVIFLVLEIFYIDQKVRAKTS
ncbi:MAG: hypothetical protein Q8K98_03995 [Bacteroidota bacterium]|nr:hypothetical protein [Bacteroidota bacterium]